MGKNEKRKVRVRRRNWDIDFYTDLMEGDGFIISEPSGVSLDGSKEKAMYGAQSPIYGTSYSDEQAFIERYRCKCGAFKSRQFEGEICPICHTKVEYKDADINITGWITLGANVVINPYYYKVLQQTIGKQIFPDIVYARYKIDINGRRSRPKDEDFEAPPLSQFSGIGIPEFYERYDEILDYFKGVKKNKVKTIELLKEQKRAVFTSHIPVYSTMLRPQSITSDTFYFQGIDKIVNTIFSLSENLKDCIDVERDYILQRLQTKVNKYWEQNFELIHGKEGIIRDQLLGGSLNYTSRNVIVPDPTLHDNEVDLSYNTFIELYKYKIIYYIMKLDDVPLSKAYSTWLFACSVFSDKVYNIMLYILKHDDPRLLINRNPTLNYYSMLLMKIRTIKKDAMDFNLSIPLSILPGLNADQPIQGPCIAAMLYRVSRERLTSGVSYKIAC